MKEIIVHNNQSLFDIAVQEYGTVEAVFDLAVANNVSITEMLTAGQVIKVPELPAEQTNREVVDYLRREGIKPATGDTHVNQTQAPDGGSGACSWIVIDN